MRSTRVPSSHWCVKTALNLAANRRRAQKLRAFFGLEQEPLVAELALQDELLASAKTDLAVREAIEALPSKLRKVVVMCELSGMSYEAISQTLEIPIGTVGSRRAAAMVKLSQRLGHLQKSRER